MKTLDEVIDIFEKACDLERRCEDCAGCLAHEWCPNDGADAVPDALHYLQSYQQLSGAFISQNTEIRPEGIYCKVCGTRLDKDYDDENA